MEVVVIHCSGSDDMAGTTRFSWPSEQWSIIRHLFVVITSCYASSQPNVSGSVVSTISFLLSICSAMIVSAFMQTLVPQPSGELCCFALPSGLLFLFLSFNFKIAATACCLLFGVLRNLTVFGAHDVVAAKTENVLQRVASSCYSVFSAVRQACLLVSYFLSSRTVKYYFKVGTFRALPSSSFLYIPSFDCVKIHVICRKSLNRISL